MLVAMTILGMWEAWVAIPRIELNMHGDLPRANFESQNQVAVSQIDLSVIHLRTMYWLLGSAV